MANNPLKFTAITDLYIYVSTPTSVTYEFSKDGVNWQRNEMELAAGESCFARGNDSPNERFTFLTEGQFSLSGSLSSLVDNGIGGPVTLRSGQNFKSFFRAQTGLKSVSSDLLSNISWTSDVENIFAFMFYNCPGLTSLPSNFLPATTLSRACYYYMFSGCQSLTSLPENLLPATTLAPYCYGMMFSYCSGLTSLPENLLPATILAEACYYAMFSSCKSLTSLPENLLPATVLCENCYSALFANCSNVKEIRVNFTNWIEDVEPTLNWVEGVAASGTFYCPSELPIKYGPNNIPSGWVVNPVYRNCFYIKNTGTEPITLANSPSDHYDWGFDYSINDTEHWIVDTITGNIVLNPGDKVYFKGTKTFATNGPAGGGASADWFRLRGFTQPTSIELGGSVASLVHDGDGDNEELVYDSSTLGRYYTFSNMFYLDFPIGISLNIDNLKLPSILGIGMYATMFMNQKGLTSIPNNFLPATSFATRCYSGMFLNTGITKVPKDLILNRHLSDECYSRMFYGCSNLNEITVYFSNWEDKETYSATEDWLDGVAETGTFHCPSGLPLIYDESHIPVGWKVEYIDKTPNFSTATFKNKLTIPLNRWARVKVGG